AEESGGTDVDRGRGVSMDELLGDGPSPVDRDGEAVDRGGRVAGCPADGSGGHDADDGAGGVPQRTTGVPWLDVCVKLDQAGEPMGRAIALVLDRDRLVHCADRARDRTRGP